ncbi:Uncharacterised protein [Mycolicibacterium vanbaalenii]|uniref:Uncharacterized protein n=1 Tax=Mycolicibacterium vanbaalenii TaxID=110539 RepID=A0A5S9RAV0_MYCVN|nr:Uncharacterised protein [Mycolicibacterium vanbaalenii]
MRELSDDQRAEFERLRELSARLREGQVVVPESFTAAVDQQLRAEHARRESVAREALTELVRQTLVASMRDQSAEHAGFSAESTARRELWSVRGVLDTQDAADAVVGVFVEWLREVPERPVSGPWASWGGDGVGP